MIELSIPDMTCGHCKASVEAALAPLARAVLVDLPARRVKLDTDTPNEAVAALARVGFSAAILADM